ncbi:hypothetical protein BDZ94DRAFT_1378071 [Collybia nuda]|uniref:Uncharacterized protein n=1 Tax=Collybia nuda TaxID=64659 RepID=A0A9P5Y2R0_9AGAR|nr:hypothetical protein BDZ94DRAFT_1378071 [Collybia nuda]
MTNSGGILATWLLGALSPPPLYRKATITLLIMSVLMVVVAGMNTYYLWLQNKKKAMILATMSRSEEKHGIGDKSAWFIYNLHKNSRSRIPALSHDINGMSLLLPLPIGSFVVVVIH